jgi:hypothetical protein
MSSNFGVEIKGIREIPSLPDRWSNALKTPEVKNLGKQNGIYIGSNFWHNLWIFLAISGLAFFLWQVYDGKFLTSYTDNSICNAQANSTCQICQSCQSCGDCSPTYSPVFIINNQTNSS